MTQQRLTTKVIRIATIAILIAATLFRACWAAQLAQHDTAPLVDPAVLAIEHGHYHAPKLDHVHDDSSGISDDDHPFIHVVLALDHQVFLTTLPERVLIHIESEFPPLSFTPLHPYQSNPYRPPRNPDQLNIKCA